MVLSEHLRKIKTSRNTGPGGGLRDTARYRRTYRLAEGRSTI